MYIIIGVFVTLFTCSICIGSCLDAYVLMLGQLLISLQAFIKPITTSI